VGSRIEGVGFRSEREASSAVNATPSD
jgi:hypothetical protein